MPDVGITDLKRSELGRVRDRGDDRGMPAVSMAAVRRSLQRDLDADFGDVILCRT